MGKLVIGRIGEEVGVFDPVLGAGGDILVGMFVSGGTGADSYLAVWRVSPGGLALAEEPSVERLPLRYPVGGFVALPHGFGFLLRSEQLLPGGQPRLYRGRQHQTVKLAVFRRVDTARRCDRPRRPRCRSG